MIGEHRNDLAWEWMAVQTDDNNIQGAVAYRIDTKSFLSPDLGTVYIDRLATAPRNRPWLVQNPHYKWVGAQIIFRVICHSYTLGLDGRVNLHSIPDDRTQAFYKKIGFIETGHPTDGDAGDMVEYELTAETAQSWLRKEGYLK